MANAVLSDNQRKAGMAHACVSALAARAGHTLQRGPDPGIGSFGARAAFHPRPGGAAINSKTSEITLARTIGLRGVHA